MYLRTELLYCFHLYHTNEYLLYRKFDSKRDESRPMIRVLARLYKLRSLNNRKLGTNVEKTLGGTCTFHIMNQIASYLILSMISNALLKMLLPVLYFLIFHFIVQLCERCLVTSLCICG